MGTRATRFRHVPTTFFCPFLFSVINYETLCEVICVSLIFTMSKMSQLLDKAKNYVTEKIGEMPKPTASITDVDFKRVCRESVEYLAKVNVSNPYSTSIPICEINYSFKSAARFCFVFLYPCFIFSFD